MLRKLISITLTFLIIVGMVIPTYAATPNVKCSVSEGSKVTITWGGSAYRLQILRDNVLFKDFQNNIQNGSQLSFVETGAGTHTYTAKAISSDNSSATAICTVSGTGKSSIRLEFINKHGTDTSVERIYNWVRIYNNGSNDIDLSKLKIRYFYTVDGEPSAAKVNVNNGQKKVECSDARVNPTQEYFQYPNGNKDKQLKDSTRMNFTKMVPAYKNTAGVTTADYYCDTYFENPGSEGKISSASYSLTLQPAFNKNVNDYESNSGSGSGFIKYYNPRNDYSFDPTASDWKENENICVYYDDQLIWGNEPFVKLNAPTNLTAEFRKFDAVVLNWTASQGAQSYIVYRSNSSSGNYTQIKTGVTATNYIDSTVEITNTPKTYYYKVAAYSANAVTSDKSEYACATVNSDGYWDLTAKILSDKGRTDFALGTYIPVAYTIFVKKDITNLQIKLDKYLIGSNLEEKLVSKKNDDGSLFLCKATLNGEPIAAASVSFENTDADQKITIDEGYTAGQTIYVEFVLKASPSSATFEAGIKDSYNKNYELGFTISCNQGGFSDYDKSLTVKITKPDQLK